MKYYSADLEAYSLRYYQKHNKVKEYIVGAKSICGDLVIDTTLDGWLDQLDKDKAEKTIYFHNGGNYDFHFLLPVLYKKYSSKNISIMMDKKRCVYKIVVKRRYRDYDDKNEKGNAKRKEHKTTFLDSFKIWPIALSVIGESVGHKKLEYGDYDILDEFANVEEFKKYRDGKAYEYFIRDLDIPLKFIEQTRQIKDIEKYQMTISATAMKDWKASRTTQSKVGFWMKHFEDGELVNDDWVWDTVKGASKGGYVMVNPKYQLKILRNVHIIDFSSLYPWVMLSEKLPYGQASEEDLPHYTLKYYRVEIKIAKAKVFPFIALPKTNKLDLVRLIKQMEIGKLEPKDETYPEELIDITITMNNYLLEYFEKYYEGEWKKYFLFNFQEAKGQFDAFQGKWKSIKENNDSNEAVRLFSKTMGASLSGKFGQDNNNTMCIVKKLEDVKIHKLPNGRPAVNGDPVVINGDLVYIRVNNGTKRDYSYVPMYDAITTKAKLKLIDLIWKNKDKAVYWDTDSLHTIGEPVGAEIHPTKYGALKLEGIYDYSVYRRNKHYYNINSKDDYQLKGSGLQVKNFNPSNLSLEQYLQEEFTLDRGKLARKIVDGGVILFEIPYNFSMNSAYKIRKGYDTI